MLKVSFLFYLEVHRDYQIFKRFDQFLNILRIPLQIYDVQVTQAW